MTIRFEERRRHAAHARTFLGCVLAHRHVWSLTLEARREAPRFLQCGSIDVRDIPWMLVRLGLETSIHHAQADEDRLAAMDVKTRAEYRAFLGLAYGFESSVEHAVWRTTELDGDVLRDRKKAARLRDDLQVLGLSASEIEDLPRAAVTIHSVAQALGWLFVIERHTLLSGLIKRHLHRALGDGVGGAFAYLSAYGDTPGARFRSLGEQLGRYAETCPPAAIVSGAKEAFRAQRQWYRAPDLRPPRAGNSLDCASNEVMAG